MGEKKEYRSAVRSRRLIHQAFLELLQEKDFEKITVTDIVKRADINRSTFYAHYPDVRGMVEALLENTVSRSVALISDLDLQTLFTEPVPFLTDLLNIGMENIENLSNREFMKKYKNRAFSWRGKGVLERNINITQ